jgi:dihydroorotate dehydrogenase (NAD+) catalytic subunit
MVFMLAGATAVQIGTANFINPRTSEDVVDGLGAYAAAEKLPSIRSIIGGLRINASHPQPANPLKNLVK